MWKSLQLFSVLGIPIRVHPSLWIFLILAAFLFNLGSGFAGFVATGFFLALVFSFVLLHELGHSVVALHHRIPVREITLYPLGGIARLAHMPREPHKELSIALAGPAVNFALAGAFSLLYFVVPGAFLAALVEVNLLLGLFNLLPGFPLDGGRVLRALLARRRSYAEATRIAVRVGQGVAIALGVTGLLALHPMLILIAVFIFFSAQAELLSAGALGDSFSWRTARRPTRQAWQWQHAANDGRSHFRVSLLEQLLRDHARASRARAHADASWHDGDGIIIDVDRDGTVRRVR